MIKIVHFSDIHADGNNLPEVKKCCDYILDMAIAHRPDLIINAGDTFNSAEIRLDSAAVKYIFSFFSRLADIAPVAAIIGTSSHDGRAIEVLNHVHGKYPIHVTADFPEQYYLFDGKFISGNLEGFTGVVDAVISAFPAPTKKWFRTDEEIQKDEQVIAQGLTAMFADFGAKAEKIQAPHILVGHWNVTGAFVSETQTLTGVDIEISKQQMELGKFDLVCLGHIHKAQQVGDNIFFAGSTQNCNWGELDDKGFYIHELESPGDGSSMLVRGRRRISDFIQTPTTKMIDIAHDLTGQEANDLDMVLYTYSREEYQNSKVRLTLKMFVDEVEKFDIPGIKSFFESVNATLDLNIIRLPRTNVRSKRILELDALYEKIQENAEILGEAIPEGIKAKAEVLEAGNYEPLMEELRAL